MEGQETIKKLEELADHYPNNEEIVLEYARGLVNLVAKQEVMEGRKQSGSWNVLSINIQAMKKSNKSINMLCRFLAKLMIRNNLYLFRRMFLEKQSDQIQYASSCKIGFEQMHYLH